MNNKGYTLVEMITVITILIAVTTGSIMGYNKIKNESYKKKCEEELKTLTNATDIYVYTTYEDGSLIASKLLTNSINSKSITLDELKDAGLIEPDINNPETKIKFDYEKTYVKAEIKDYVINYNVKVINEDNSEDEITCSY